MTDEELIERLRDWPYQGETMANAAADRIKAQAAEIERLRGDLAKAMEALQSVIEACDQGRMIPRSGVGGMTIEANIKGSIYVGVPAWPIEEARTTLAELKGRDDE